MDGKKVTLKQVEELLPQRTSLIYIDYRDSFEDSADLIQRCISSGTFDYLFDESREWFWDHESESIRCLISELEDDILKNFDMDEDEVDEFLEKYDDWIREIIYDRDDSTPVQDMISNTSKIIAHYDTGYYMEGGSWNWSEAEIRLERMRIKYHLGIMSISEYDDALDMTIQQASYGGALLIYFELDLYYAMKNLHLGNTIQFENFMLGIVDHFNGSGDVMDRAIHAQIKMPFDTDNLYLEKSIKYNWTYSIAGMSYDWADSTEMLLLPEESDHNIGKSLTADHLAQEAIYNETYRKGGCSFGDKDIKRHRNTEYVNNYPCGTRCHDCGTFWID